MREPVIIKSSKYGMTLILDPAIPFEDLVRAVCQKFHDMTAFFGTTSFALGIEGRKLTVQEVQVIIEAIELNSDIHITMLQDRDPHTDQAIVRQVKKDRLWNIYRNAMIINGSVRREKEITSETSVIILGDLGTRARVQSAGNVIVMGSLDGSVYAGYPDNNECYIAANEFNNNNLQIGTHNETVTLAPKWKRRIRRAKSITPMAAVVFENHLIIEPMYSGLIPQLTERSLKDES